MTFEYTRNEMAKAARNNGIPGHCIAGLVEHVCEGRMTGDFLTAVLENDLYMAAIKADGENRVALRAYAIWLRNFTPGDCYGSPEAVAAWRERGGLEGVNERNVA